MKWFFISLLLIATWVVAALGVLLPLLGIAWITERLTDLTLAQACLLVFGYGVALVYLLQTYSGNDGLFGWLLALCGTILLLATAVLEGLLLQKLMNLTLFQAVLTASSAQILLAYISANSFLNPASAFFDDADIDDMTDVEIESWLDGEDDFTPPPPRKRRRRKQR